MREKLEAYVDLLFAGNPEAEEMKLEILQNTLDRYDDLVAEGKSPEAAYSLAISGIGEVGELLTGTAVPSAAVSPAAEPEAGRNRQNNQLLRAAGVALYILCPVPLFALQNEIGLCLLLLLVAAATALMIIAGKKSPFFVNQQELTPEQKRRRSIAGAVWTIAAAVYLLISLATGAWHISWLVFPIAAAINGLINAVMDLKKEKNHEN